MNTTTQIVSCCEDCQHVLTATEEFCADHPKAMVLSIKQPTKSPLAIKRFRNKLLKNLRQAELDAQMECPNCDGPCVGCWEETHSEHRYNHNCPVCQEDGPPDGYGEEFCGREAAAFERDSMTALQRLK